MVAQRKLADPTLAVPLEDAVPADAAVTRELEEWRPTEGGVSTSPAILLQQQLAARFAGAGAGTAEAQGAVEPKWPMPLRIATIVGLSLALWGGIFVATAMMLT